MLSRRSPFVYLALVVAIFVAAQASAQPVAQVYPVKFVCGYELGDVPLLSDPDPFPKKYEDLKPGNYATLVNILMVDFTGGSLSFAPAAVIEGLGPISLPATTLTALQTAQIGCPDILSALTPFLPAPPMGEVYEGYLVLITPPGDPLQVDSVYTFESKDAFREHLVWGLDPDGVLQDRLLQLLQAGSRFGPYPPVDFFRAIDIAASGAGGLGVGASIDVVRVLPRDVITTPGVISPLDQFLPQ